MLNPNTLINFTCFPNKEQVQEFNLLFNTLKPYQILPNLKYFRFYSEKFNLYLVACLYAYQHKNYFKKWYAITQNKQRKWLFLMNDTFIIPNTNNDYQWFDSLENVIDVINPNWNIYTYDKFPLFPNNLITLK